MNRTVSQIYHSLDSKMIFYFYNKWILWRARVLTFKTQVINIVILPFVECIRMFHISMKYKILSFIHFIRHMRITPQNIWSQVYFSDWICFQVVYYYPFLEKFSYQFLFMWNLIFLQKLTKNTCFYTKKCNCFVLKLTRKVN